VGRGTILLGCFIPDDELKDSEIREPHETPMEIQDLFFGVFHVVRGLN